MPTTLTIPLTTTEPLFFDEAWPLEALFLETLARSTTPVKLPEQLRLKPYTLSPVWPEKQRGVPAANRSGEQAYHWRVGLLDDSLAASFLEGLSAAKTLNLAGHSLAVGRARAEEWPYENLGQRVQAQVKTRPEARREIGLEFITPVVLRRHGIPMPLPDPVLVFHSWLLAWDTFAPRELWVNINLLDAVEAHLAVVEHQVETRSMRVADERLRTGFLGRVRYKMMAWEKLGAEFLGTLHMLARFSEFCGTGELTEHGLGQTRYLKRKT
ncbi:MAG: CRISPR system precrRNA processing endoribonuclease RAMP protein Cas6 [Chloroflexota bacterium]